GAGHGNGMAIERALESMIRRTGLLGRLQEAWRRDVDRLAIKDRRELQKMIKRLEGASKRSDEQQRQSESRLKLFERRVEDVERAARAGSEARMKAIERGFSQLALAAATNDRQAHLTAQWPPRFNPRDICAHVAQAISTAPLEPTPCAHLVVEQ